MTNHQSADVDLTLTATLRALNQRLDPVPDEVTVAGVAAFSLRTVDSVLANLDYDSLLDDSQPARAPEGVRHLTFVTTGLSVELDVGDDGLRGHLVPPTRADVELRWPGGSTSVTADEWGAFSVPTIPPGPVSLRCQRGPSDTTSPVITDWVTL